MEIARQLALYPTSAGTKHISGADGRGLNSTSTCTNVSTNPRVSSPTRTRAIPLLLSSVAENNNTHSTFSESAWASPLPTPKILYRGSVPAMTRRVSSRTTHERRDAVKQNFEFFVVLQGDALTALNIYLAVQLSSATASSTDIIDTLQRPILTACERDPTNVAFHRKLALRDE